jgi:Tfp pilus assembly protein PilN
MTEDGQLPANLTEDDLSRIVPGSRWKIYSAGDDLAFGLALAHAHFGPKSAPLLPLRINLLKQIVREKHAAERKAMRVKLGRMAPAIAVIILLVVSGTLWWQVRRAEEKLRSIQNVRQASKQQIEDISRLSGIEKGLLKQIEAIDWVADDYPMVSYRLLHIARTIPDSLWLKEVYIPEKQISRKKKRNEQQSVSKMYVVGYAHEQHQITEFLGNLRKSECFSDAKQESTSEVRLAGERILEFKIGLTSNLYRERL